MRATRVVLVVTILCSFLAVPAGAAESPVVIDPCGTVTGTREAVRPEHDVCAAFLSTLSDPEVDEPVRLAVRVRLAGPVDGRVPSGYYAGWTAGGCELMFVAEDANDTHERRRALLVDCPGTQRRTILLDDAAFTVSAQSRDARFEITFDGVLEGLAGDHAYEAVLTDAWAAAGPRVGPYVLGLYGHDDNVGTFSLLYDHAGPGGAYRVGA